MPSAQTANPNTAEGAAAVAPSDSTMQAVRFRALWIGVSGDVSVLLTDGTSVTVVGALGLLPLGGLRVNSTGTTAASILALY